MSQQMDKPPAEDGGGTVSFSTAELTRIIETAMAEGATKTVALIKEKVNIEEEDGGPNQAPPKKPPFPPR